MNKFSKFLKTTALGLIVTIGGGSIAMAKDDKEENQGGNGYTGSNTFIVENVSDYEKDGSVQFKCLDESTATLKKDDCRGNYQFIMHQRGQGKTFFEKEHDATNKKTKRLKAVFEEAKTKAPLKGGFLPGDGIKCKKDIGQKDFTCKQYRPTR